MTTAVTITHTSEDGTLATGDTRPHAETLKAHGFRWSRNLGCWYLPNSRDHLPREFRIQACAKTLNDAGATVTLDLSREIASAAEREANRAKRIEARQDALEAKADRKGAEADSRFSAADRVASMIPFGQPILVGHHSERAHRRDMDTINRNMSKGVEIQREAEEAARKAAASERNSAHRLTAPATMRRIEKLEAEARDLARKMTEATEKNLTNWLERLTILAEVNADDIAYWKNHLAALELEGVKVWSAADFQKGDLARSPWGFSKVVRVNAKSLTVESGYSWTDTLPYDKVRGRIAAADIPAN